jgi:haloalkane dehalogenase
VDRAAYPFETHLIRLPAGRMHYVDEGAGEGLLFVHGTPTWSFEYRHLIRHFSPRFRTIAPDHLGFGLSERPSGFAYTPEAHADVLASFVRTLGLDRLALVVHDFGGPIGLPLALAGGSRVTRLVLFNTWAWPFDDDPAIARGARVLGSPVGRFLYRYANASLRLIAPSAYGNRSKLTAAVHRQYLEVFRDRDARVRVLHTLAKSLLGSRAHYARLLAHAERLRRLPTLIVWGMKDPAFQSRHLARWETLLPEATVVRLADAGHWPHEEEPEAVAEAMSAFLRSSST